MRPAGGERLVAGQAAVPGPGVRRGVARPAEPGEGGGLVPFPEPKGGKRLAALAGEGGDPCGVERVAHGRDRRVDVVERQPGHGQARRRPPQPEVGEKAVVLQRERADPAAARREVEHGVAVLDPHAPRQAAVALTKQRVDDARSQQSFGMILEVRGRSGSGPVDGYHLTSVTGHSSAARAAATARSTAAASGPIALMTPR